jgi:large subunit ribosomal protein L4
MPKKKRRAALCGALSMKLQDDAFRVIERFEVVEPKTREVVRLIKNFTDESKVLLVVGESDQALHLSARNIQQVKVLPVVGLNVYDLMYYHTVICAEEALEKIAGRLG